ncbi:hypothetical protein [Bradyrhizobium sp.]|uniref:hypothetical protein n=1 Tax=Bradyrhizobium sp. TaxID=376 RepID=UPI002D7EDC0E|nr:hypothetical protein [Bradyrhizobium sp.]
MMLRAFGYRRSNQGIVATCTRAALLAALIVLGSLFANREAAAGASVAAAAQSADAGVSACGSNSGKVLYSCIANVLDRLSSEISDVKVPAARTALHTAASRLRAAANMTQALSAISQCRAAISSAIGLARTIGRGGSQGLDAIAGVLSHAAQLIQSKG